MATSDRGFASMDENKQRKIASMGGKASGIKRSANRGTGSSGSTGSAKRGGQNSSRSR